jgi:hypothetical protein
VNAFSPSLDPFFQSIFITDLTMKGLATASAFASLPTIDTSRRQPCIMTHEERRCLISTPFVIRTHATAKTWGGAVNPVRVVDGVDRALSDIRWGSRRLTPL